MPACDAATRLLTSSTVETSLALQSSMPLACQVPLHPQSLDDSVVVKSRFFPAHPIVLTESGVHDGVLHHKLCPTCGAIHGISFLCRVARPSWAARRRRCHEEGARQNSTRPKNS